MSNILAIADECWCLGCGMRLRLCPKRGACTTAPDEIDSSVRPSTIKTVVPPPTARARAQHSRHVEQPKARPTFINNWDELMRLAAMGDDEGGDDGASQD